MRDGGRDIPTGSGGGGRSTSTSRAENFITALASSLRSTGGPTIEEAIARDLQDWSDSDDDEAVSRSRHDSALGSDRDDDESDESTRLDQGDAASQQQSHVMYRRPSGVAFGASRPIINPRLLEPAEESTAALLSRVERKRSRDAERSLLRDNHVLPPKHARDLGAAGAGAAAVAKPASWLRRAYKSVFGTRLPRDEAGVESGLPAPATETTALLGPQPQAGASANVSAAAAAAGAHRTRVDEQWEEAVASGKIRTTWQREAKTIISYAAPLIVTFLLQYSINVTSIFAVGRIGKEELGAVSLASMTAVITGYAPIQGLATSLDTLCAQAYGSGHKHLVGLQFQRMTFFLLLCFVPMAVLWWLGDVILTAIIPEPRSAQLAGQYLKVLIAGGPAFIVFEAAKRYVQAQGLFRATTYVLLVAAPLNVLANWLFVWHFGWGFIGAPLAIVFTENVMPVLLLLYVRFVDGYQCWGGLSWKAWTNWGVMIRLALPGMIMVEAEYLAFEILTLVSSRFGASYLAAQSVLVTLSSTSYQIPFPLSIAASTRIANLVGAGLVDAAKVTAKVSVWGAFIVGTVNLVLYTTLRYQLPLLFTKDPEVVAIVASVLPVVSVMQVFDGLCAGAHGLLRGIGRQEIGGYVNLLVYYVIALPLSFALALGLGWKLSGLWAGVTLGLIIVAVIEYWFAAATDWDRAARDAARRNEAG